MTIECPCCGRLLYWHQSVVTSSHENLCSDCYRWACSFGGAL